MFRHTLLALVALMAAVTMRAADEKTYRISTDATDLVLRTSSAGRLYQVYLGEKLRYADDFKNLSWTKPTGTDGYPTPHGFLVMNGMGNDEFFQPGFGVVHNDGNMSNYLVLESADEKAVDGGREYIFNMKDPQYPVYVKLHYVAYPKENVIKQWTEISHSEKKPVTLQHYASAMVYFSAPSYYLTEFASDHTREARMLSQQLQPGKKVLDTKLGSRAAMYMNPFFELGVGAPVSENHGTVMIGTIAWTGNFNFTFEVDNAGHLRVVSGINNYASSYVLDPGKTFTTPEFIYTISYNGSSEGSRNLHDWARRYSLKDGDKPRMTLLNNWENTYFSFDQEKLASLMKEAKTFGVDMFLLDDGWFGNGDNARNHDRAGLGDWEPNLAKLPGGIPALTKAAKDAGVKFGIWIEPEMVNPKSELYTKHPDWAITLPNREPYYYRHQLVLDLSNPKVQDYVYGVVAKILTENPEVAYFKWDCNSPITNVYSHYLKDRQQNLYIDHVRGLQNILQRIKQNFPNCPMMLCSGGGARCDYDALKYFTEFWCSDNTNPVERIFIQWGFSHIFPAKAMCAHVTSWNRATSIKFRTDVASMCKLGFDIGLKDLSDNDLTYCRGAIGNWNRLQDVILDGDQYRLVSPYETSHMAVNYVDRTKTHAVLFAYDVYPRRGEKIEPVRLQGLDPDRRYQVKEINLMPGAKGDARFHDRTYSGDYLMKVGLNVLTNGHTQSHVVEIVAQ